MASGGQCGQAEVDGGVLVGGIHRFAVPHPHEPRAAAEAFAARPWCLRRHWCSRLENPHRGSGLKDPWDEPYQDLTRAVAETNHRLAGLVRRRSYGAAGADRVG
ncbi:hypothetical protein ABZ636_13045 [Streptomyces sp. NPDC007251]|uniref:hypothetical protein n=1 Tax=unclassified Streptomyces TaxID=2593676 RepID=UPI00340C0B23